MWEETVGVSLFLSRQFYSIILGQIFSTAQVAEGLPGSAFSSPPLVPRAKGVAGRISARSLLVFLRPWCFVPRGRKMQPLTDASTFTGLCARRDRPDWRSDRIFSARIFSPRSGFFQSAPKCCIFLCFSEKREIKFFSENSANN